MTVKELIEKLNELTDEQKKLPVLGVDKHEVFVVGFRDDSNEGQSIILL